ncbi:MAG TPA: hypothetical protein VN512_12510 [Clostridia bacterium]|nr:hypothetical protein [Clostridia bacterium]
MNVDLKMPKRYGVALLALTSLFLWSSCAKTVSGPSPSPELSPSPAAAVSPSLSPEDSETAVGSFPDNPVLLFFLSYDTDTVLSRAAFYDALSVKGGIDALNAIMEVSEAEPYPSKCRLSAGRLLYDGLNFSGTVSNPQGEGSLMIGSGKFTFTYADGTALYGTVEEERLGCFALDADGTFLYMVRMASFDDGWLVCVDTPMKRSLMQWGEASRFTSFSGDFKPYLPQATPTPVQTPGWEEAAESGVIPEFAEENWLAFSWEALSEGADTVYELTGGTLFIRPISE